MNSKTFISCLLILFILLGSVAYFIIPEEKKEYPYQFTTVVIFQNDAPWLKEWIEYYKLIGADHMLFFNNESTDHYMEVLEPYIQQGLVELIDFPNRPTKNSLHGWVYATQVTAYRDALRRMKGKTKWIAFVDTDEFIVPHAHDTLVEALKPYEGIGGVALNWNCFGHNYLEEIPKGSLLIECLTRRNNFEDPINTYTKVVVQPEYVNRIHSPHFVQMKKGKTLIHTDFSKFKHPGSHSFEHITINHYMTRTKSYLAEKIRKKELMNLQPLTDEEKATYHKLGNDIEDPDRYIFRFVSQLRERMGLNGKEAITPP